MHPHRDMEIITYILQRALAHKDSMGNGSIIHPGDGQRMSAGTGVRHSEYNASKTEPVHLLQIWILPEQQGVQPSYEQKTVDLAGGELLQIAGPAAANQGGVTIHQDARLFAARLGKADTLRHAFETGRHGWLQVAGGSVRLNGKELVAGDGAAISDETALEISGRSPQSEILLFDLA